MWKALFLLTLACLCLPVFAQPKVSLSGQVIDKSRAAVPFANVALYALPDSILTTGAVSDDNGKFSFKAPAGRYFLKVTFVSYADKIIPDILIADKPLDLGVVTLRADEDVLQAVVVKGERSMMELKLDKRVFNVGKDLTNISGNASDVLGNVPSVTVDVDGNVQLRGSQNVQILIDGKPSALTGLSTADALQQLPANMIESVEVITNPSSRYTAEGEVGILNIILKKENRNGVHGAVTVNVGDPIDHGVNMNVNLRRDKFNLFATYGFSYRKSPGTGSSFQRFMLPDTTFSYDQFNDRLRSRSAHNLITGIDWYFNPTSTLTGSIALRTSNGLNTTNIFFRDLNSSDQVERTLTRVEREAEPENDREVSFSYRKELAKPGQTFTADAKWIENLDTELSQFTQTDDSDGSTTYQRSSNTENERNIFLQADYVHPFGKEGKFETGLRSTLREIDNAFLVEQQNDLGSWNPIPGFNNHVVYTENIHAAYFSAGNTLKKFSYQAGLRGELTDIAVSLENTGVINRQHYFNLFPSAFTAYKLDENHSLQLSYSYRISRPRFRELLPFSSYSNNRSLRTGNPLLRPEFTHSMEAAYLLNWSTGSLLSSAYYRQRTGVVQRITVVDSVGFNRSFPVNLARENAYGVEFNFTWNPVDWLRYTANGNFYRAITNGEYENTLFSRDTYTWTGRSIVQLNFKKAWNFQGVVNYRAPQNTPQGQSLSLYSVDLALSRDVFKGNGTVTLSVRDLFNSRRFRNELNTAELYSTSNFQWRVRQVRLSFTYRLNQKKQYDRDEEYSDDET